nr:hypothetical protein [uncultured Anaerosporobacter sp.]
MEKINGLEQLTKVVATACKVVSDNITLSGLKACNNAVMDYDQFYFMCISDYVRGISKIGEGFAFDQFGYLLEVFLTDDTSIKVMVDRSTFKHNFLSENTIIIDTLECTSKLNELASEGYLITELMISEPVCYDFDEKEYVKRELMFSGLECGGLGGVDHGSISEVEQNTINRIP